MIEYSQQDVDKFFDYWRRILRAQEGCLERYTMGPGMQAFEHTGEEHQYGKEIFSPGQKILFLGCGAGDEVRWALEQGYAAEGVTLGTINLRECKRAGLPVYEADMHFLPMPDETYDGVVSFQTVEHSPSHMILFYEIFRVLKKGGQTYHQSPDAQTWTMDGDLHHILCIDDYQARGILKKTGFKDVRCERIGDGKTIEIYGKKP